MVVCGDLCEKTVLTYSKWVSIISGAIGMVLISLQLFKHMSRTNPKVQRHQMRMILILLFHPIYTLTSILSIWVDDEYGITDTVRGMYEGVLLYSFFDLLVAYICQPPGEKEYKFDRLLTVFEEHKVIKYSSSVLVFRWPIKWLCGLVGMKVFTEDSRNISNHQAARAYFDRIKFVILQYVLTRPILVIIDLILIVLGWEKKFIDVIVESFAAILLSVVLYYVLNFYHITVEHLNKFGVNPFLKFILIKGLLGLIFWQSLLFKYAVFTDVHSSFIQNEDADMRDYLVECASDALLCIELVVFAIIASMAYDSKPLLQHSQPKEEHSLELTQVVKFLANDVDEAKDLFISGKAKRE